MTDYYKDTYKKLKTFNREPTNREKEPRLYHICDKCKILYISDKCHRCFKRRNSLLSS